MSIVRRETLWWLGIILFLLTISAWRYRGLEFTGVPTIGYVAEIAGNPYYGGNRPFSYRLLMPVIFNLVGYIPKPNEPLIPILGVLGMGVSLAALMRAFGCGYFISAFGVVLLGLSSGLTDILKEFGVHNVDASSHILILLAMYGMVKQNDALFSLASMLGVFNREWALAILPGWYLYTYGISMNIQSIMRTVRTCGPAIIIYASMLWLYYPNTASGVISEELNALMPQFRQGAYAFYGFVFERLGVSYWFESVFSSTFYKFALVSLWPFAALGLLCCSRGWMRFSLYYTIVCMAQFLVATDVWRLSFYLFPVVISLVGIWLQDVMRQWNRKYVGLIVLLILLLFGFLSAALWSLPLSLALAAAIQWRTHSTETV